MTSYLSLITRLICTVIFAITMNCVSAAESPFIYGVHDHDTGQQEYLDHLKANGATGWVTATIAIGANPNDSGGDDFSWIADQGHSVIVRLNYGYCPSGTIPAPHQYDDFAKRAANYVAATRGADIFIIGNETNLAIEWPSANGHASYVSPQDYASVFRKTYDAIKAVRPDAKVISQALAPFAGPFPSGNTCGYSHDASPLNWVQYMNQMLTAIKNTGGIDGIALHINSRGYAFGDIHSTQKVTAGRQNLHFSFYVYKDWIDHGIPPDLYSLPLYATEANGIYYWSGGHPENPGSHYEPGWMQEIYAEIDRYNQQAASTGKPIFHAVNMYRWCAFCDGWNIDSSPYKGQILSDLDQAAVQGYRWPTAGTPPDNPQTPNGDNVARNALNWAASSSYNSSFEGDKAYDGVVSAASKWTSDGTASESWLSLDLGQPHDISGFIVKHAGAAGEDQHFNLQAYRLEVGDSLFGPWSTAATVTNASQQDSNTTVLASEVTTQYVRLLITDAGIDNHARIPEFEVYGTVSDSNDDPDHPTGVNLALSAIDWSASSTFNAASGGEKAYDGVVTEGSKWTSDGQSLNSWLGLDLGTVQSITGFVVRHASDAGEATHFNTQAFHIETGSSLSGPWTSVATIDNSSQENTSIVVLQSPTSARYVRLLIIDAGIDNHARIPEFEVWGQANTDPGNLIGNGDFTNGLAGWSVWSERGALNQSANSGALQLQSINHNGGLYQTFNTGGPGNVITINGSWASDPTAPQRQWAEVLVINGARTPVNGGDVSANQGDVVLVYKNDTWTVPAGWSGDMASTSAVANVGVFTANDTVATLILKSGNTGGVVTGTRFDDVIVKVSSGDAPNEQPPNASSNANPTTGVVPLTVNFDASGSSDPNGDALTYSWDFGDGTQASGVQVAHTYHNVGSYVATLTVSDDNGGSDQVATTIQASQSIISMPDFCPPTLDFRSIRADLNRQGQDLAFVKIGFHVGPAGNQNGLGEWMQCLDAAGVPFFLKSADSAGQIFEAAQLKAVSGVPHVLVYRRSLGKGWNADVPDYNKAPYDAAVEHWRRHIDEFPPRARTLQTSHLA